MNENKLGLELRAIAGKASPGSHCLDEYALAALAAGGDELENRAELEQHLSDCSWCLGRVSELALLQVDDDVIEISEGTLQRALALARRPARTGHPVRWATAAVIVLALGVVYLNQIHRPGIDSALRANPETQRQSRNIGGLDVRPRILSPVEGSQLRNGGEPIRWTEIPDRLYYDVRIVSLDGELIGEQRVTQAHWEVPAGMLQAGAEYYVRVDAYLAEAKRLSSSHVLFSAEQH